jgi:hypothetical protein
MNEENEINLWDYNYNDIMNISSLKYVAPPPIAVNSDSCLWTQEDSAINLNDEIKELRKRISELSTELNNVIARDQIRQKEFETIMNILKEKINKNA